jgi:UDP-N-acetylglucosamine transferase subunit ALG13
MILFTVGTSEPFDRLVAVADAVAGTCGERVVVQGGRSRCHLERAELVGFLGHDELVALVSEARIIVTHAGAGSALLVLGEGKRPLLVPRLRRHGEAIDDHQVQFGRRLAELGLAQYVEDPADLPEIVGALSDGSEPPKPETPSLGSALRAHLLERLGPPPEAI